MNWPWNRPATCAKCEEIGRELKSLAQDFEELQDKVYRWMKRQNMRHVRGEAERAMDGKDATEGVASSAEGNERIARLLARRQRATASE